MEPADRSVGIMGDNWYAYLSEINDKKAKDELICYYWVDAPHFRWEDADGNPRTRPWYANVIEAALEAAFNANIT